MDAIKDLPVNVVDVGVLLVLLVSAVLAYARGFVHEVLSVGGWVGAIFATFYGFPYAKPIARQYIALDLAADLVAGTVIFIFTLVFLSLITRAIAKQVQNSALNVLDRSLGFLFGLARGAALVCIAYIGLSLIMPVEDQPAIIRDARTMQLIKPGAALLEQLVPDHITAQSGSGSKTDIDVKGLLTPSPKQQDVPAQQGYNKDQRKNLERLIDGTGSTQ